MIYKKPVMHLLSGGLDSVVLLYALRRQKCDVYCVIYDYAQQHDNEIECARHICMELGVPYRLVGLRDIFKETSLVKGGKGSFIVPYRNGVFLSVAAALAVQAKAEAVTIGCNADDATLFPDCRSGFLTAQQSTVLFAGCTVEICAPFITMTKREIVTLGKELGVDFDKTWSCYLGGHTPCGECNACKVRDAALA